MVTGILSVLFEDTVVHIITDNIKESHNVVFNDMAGYEPDKDIIISDGYNSYISDVAADIGLGEDYVYFSYSIFYAFKIQINHFLPPS